MCAISYSHMLAAISLLWFMVRFMVCIRQKHIRWKREVQLLLAYICIIVVTRFTFFPFSKVNGQIQPLIFDAARLWPLRINLLPVAYLLDYPTLREALLNFIGNYAMFIPIGIIWPLVFKHLDTPAKAIAAGVGFSLCIEILQLPFFDRVSDIDDLLLNSLGYLTGYGIYLLVKWLKRRFKRR